MSETEEITRALAAEAAPDDSEYAHCVLCGSGGFGTGADGDLFADLDDPDNHQPRCPWAMARRWVASRASGDNVGTDTPSDANQQVSGS